MKQIVLIINFLFIASFFSFNSFGQDKNFHIYLCFGQSNMEGAAKYEPIDTITDARFQVLAAVDCEDSGREKGKWYPAKAPLTRCNTGITPADYFGKTLIENFPDSIRIGVINVSVGGCKIQLFDKDSVSNYVATAPDWMVGMLKAYDNNPYERLIEMAKIAQQSGVIKGILLHQGESNTGDQDWPNKVNKVYTNMLNDLDLKKENTPILVGELLATEEGGKCGSMNTIIHTLPNVIPNAYVVSSANCTGQIDGLHFTTEGYRQLGKNYAHTMLKYLSVSPKN